MITEKVLKFAEKYDMFPKGCKVLCAVSGGADSMCMLALLHRLSTVCGFLVEAATFDHRLRGDESRRDVLFVKEYCEKNNIPCHAGSGNVKGFAEEMGMGLEEAARIMRYSFLQDAAEKAGADFIATAHNAEDNAETVIMNLARGTGLKGLCGIPPVRGNVIRPLLPVKRSEIEAWLSENGISHVEDSTNSKDEYTRNRVRHHVLPVLNDINPLACDNIFSACELLRDDESLLSELSDTFINELCCENEAPAKELSLLPPALSSRVIRTMSKTELSRSHVKAVLDICSSDDPSACTDIPGMTVRREYEKAIFGGDAAVDVLTPVFPKVGENVGIPELCMQVFLETSVFDGIINKSFTSFPFKKSAVCGNIVVRSRKTGDAIRLNSGSGTKSLKKLFIEKHIPANMRGIVPVIADDNGPLAVYGVGMDIRAAAQKDDEVLLLSINKID